MNRRSFPLAALSATLAVISAACGVELEDYPRRPLAQTSFVFAADDSLLTELHAVEDRVVLPTSQIPRSIRDATVAIEDRRFYLHHGIDGRRTPGANAIVGGRWVSSTSSPFGPRRSSTTVAAGRGSDTAQS